MTPEQYIDALEAGCPVHVGGYTFEPDGGIYRIRPDDGAPDGWHVDPAGALRLVGVLEATP